MYGYLRLRDKAIYDQRYCLVDIYGNTIYKVIINDSPDYDNVAEEIFYVDGFGNVITPDEDNLIPCGTCYQVVNCINDSNAINKVTLTNGNIIDFDNINGPNMTTIEDFADYMVDKYGGSYFISSSTDTPHFTDCKAGSIEIQFKNMNIFIEEVVSFNFGTNLNDFASVKFLGDCQPELSIDRLPGEIGDRLTCNLTGQVGTINDWNILK